MDGRNITRDEALAIADRQLGPTAREQALAAEIARLRAELEEAQTLLKQMRDALAPGESTTWNFLVNTLGVDFADDWHRDLRAANYELEEARGALDAATELLSLPEHAWGPEDYEQQRRVNDAYKRLAARAEGRGDRRGERGEGQ